MPFRRGPRTTGLGEQARSQGAALVAQEATLQVGGKREGVPTLGGSAPFSSPGRAGLQEVQGRKALGPAAALLPSAEHQWGRRVEVLEERRAGPEEMRINTSELEGRSGGLQPQPLGSP